MLCSKSSPNDLRFDFGTSFTLEEDYVTRGKVSQKRIVAAFQTDHAAGNPFRQFLSKTKNADNLNNLCFWQDVEKCRVDYNFGTMEFDDFLKAVNNLELSMSILSILKLFSTSDEAKNIKKVF